MTAILEFMYAGEVNVAQDQLPQFLKTAERLKEPKNFHHFCTFLLVVHDFVVLVGCLID